MKRVILGLLFTGVYLFSHPVSYTIDLKVSYDNETNEALIICKSNSRNKCGLFSIKLLDENDETIVVKRFPFLKKSIKISLNYKPKKMIFFLRKVPEHTYIKIFENN